MTRSARSVSVVLACCLGGSLLVGCTSGGDEPAADASSPTDAASAAPHEAVAQEEPALPTGVVDEFLGLVSAVEEETSQARQQRLAEMERILSACMTEQGFDYTPVDWSYVEDLEAMQDAAPPSAEELTGGVADHGYGISTFVSGSQETPGSAVGGLHVDPNEEYVAAMSDAERQAYETALWGVGQGEAYITGEEPYDWTRWGCQGRSDHQLGIDQREYFDYAPYEDLRAQIDAMYMAVGDDPRVLGAEREWSACMAEAGFPGLDRVADAMGGIMAQSDQIWVETFGAATFDLSTEDYLTSPEYLAATEENARRHAELAEVEIPTAVADYACQDEVGYSRHYAEASVELQQAFYDEHRIELEAWLAAYEEFDART